MSVINSITSFYGVYPERVRKILDKKRIELSSSKFEFPWIDFNLVKPEEFGLTKSKPGEEGSCEEWSREIICKIKGYKDLVTGRVFNHYIVNLDQDDKLDKDTAFVSNEGYEYDYSKIEAYMIVPPKKSIKAQ